MLKLIAMLTMLVDHIGLLFFPEIMVFRTGHPGQPVALSSKNASANGHCRSYHGHMAGLFLFGCLNGDSLFIEVPGPEGDTHSSLRCWCPGDYVLSTVQQLH